MPVNALNAALIGAVLENTPKNSNPAATVAEILNIGREAACLLYTSDAADEE